MFVCWFVCQLCVCAAAVTHIHVGGLAEHNTSLLLQLSNYRSLIKPRNMLRLLRDNLHVSEPICCVNTSVCSSLLTREERCTRYICTTIMIQGGRRGGGGVICRPISLHYYVLCYTVTVVHMEIMSFPTSVTGRFSNFCRWKEKGPFKYRYSPLPPLYITFICLV